MLIHSRLPRLAAISLAAVAIVTFTALLGARQSRVQSPFGARSYYLTRTAHDGNEALTACAAGFHMASLWEIFDPTQLRYDRTLGLTRDDSGWGPPSGYGWIRTGGGTVPDSSQFATPNCNAWTSDGGFHEGTAASLTSALHLNLTSAVAPWNATVAVCHESAHVWCVQD